MSHGRHGVVEGLRDDVLTGWAIDLAASETSLVLLVDGLPVASFVATGPRPDVRANGVPRANVGFRLELPAALCDGVSRTLSVRFRDGTPLRHVTADGEVSDSLVHRSAPMRVVGRVEGTTGDWIHGWAYREDRRTGTRSGGVAIVVSVGGIPIETIRADAVRRDVATANACELRCGFMVRMPPVLRARGRTVLTFVAVPDGTALDGSPFEAAPPPPSTVAHLRAMQARLDALAAEMWALRDELRELLIEDDHTLATYDAWAARYRRRLPERVAEARRRRGDVPHLDGARPLVSIVCATRGATEEALATTCASVLGQSWPAWELLIVGDHSTTAMRSDARVRLGWTDVNDAVAAVRGPWTAFIDAGATLEEYALEAMLLHADGAVRALYADDDAIDADGVFVDPRFKPDWNYRLTLSATDVGGLLIVATETLCAAGPLRCDGARDLDVMLRLSETLAPDAIRRVPEIVLHRRADAIGAKGDLEAERLAVAEHLARKGLRADVTTCPTTGTRDVRWSFDETPRVTIIVPFRDQASMTRRCVDAVLTMTDYASFDLLLIDNWSVSAETAAWVREVSADARVRVIRIEDRFNFSALNNAAARASDSPFLVFLNNDVLVEQRDWLRRLVDEALADPLVAAVGAKLVYPDGTVQHGGVVLGVGGVADHAFRFIGRDEPGYMARAVTTQELAAVTAACMLCRASAFEAMGGFDATHLPVAFNDVDLCLRLRAAGWRVVYQPAVVAIHHESLSRGDDRSEAHEARFFDETRTMLARWGETLRADPFYPRHFSRQEGLYERLAGQADGSGGRI